MSELLNIGEVIVNGIYFDPRNGDRLRSMNLQGVLEAAPRLFDLLQQREIEYVLVGGVSQLAYVEGRNTQDIDLITHRSALNDLPELVVEDQTSTSARTRLGDLQVALLFSTDKLFKKVLKDCAVKKQVAGQIVRCATAEAILMLKLYALPDLYRQGRFARAELYQSDVQTLLRELQPDVGAVMGDLAENLLASDLDEIRKIVAEIQAGIAKSATRFRGPAT